MWLHSNLLEHSFWCVFICQTALPQSDLGHPSGLSRPAGGRSPTWRTGPGRTASCWTSAKTRKLMGNFTRKQQGDHRLLIGRAEVEQVDTLEFLGGTVSLDQSFSLAPQRLEVDMFTCPAPPRTSCVSQLSVRSSSHPPISVAPARHYLLVAIPALLITCLITCFWNLPVSRPNSAVTSR